VLNDFDQEDHIKVLDLLVPEVGAFYVMDRGYTDFARLYMLNLGAVFFVIRARSDLKFRRLYSHPVDKHTGLKCDQSVFLSHFYGAKNYPDKLCRIKYYDEKIDKTLVFLTNNFPLPALTIAALYRCRWQVELLFKWIKQHLRIKSFFGTSENAVKTQIWICHLSLCAGGNHQEAVAPRCQPLHNITNFERNYFRENAFKKGSVRGRLHSGTNETS
jgi:hypothetical protein